MALSAKDVHPAELEKIDALIDVFMNMLFELKVSPTVAVSAAASMLCNVLKVASEQHGKRCTRVDCGFELHIKQSVATLGTLLTELAVQPLEQWPVVVTRGVRATHVEGVPN